MLQIRSGSQALNTMYRGRGPICDLVYLFKVLIITIYKWVSQNMTV